MKRCRFALALLVFLSQVASPAFAADFYWDPDANAGNNNIDGTGLGGSGTWDATLLNWWDETNDIAWPNNTSANAIFTGPAGPPALSDVTLSGMLNANQLTFLRSGYTLTGGEIVLGGTDPSIHVNLGESATIDSVISGSNGLIKTGGGSLRLGNATNSYTGGPISKWVR